MTPREYFNKRDELETQYDKDKAALSWEYVRVNAEFKVGDFIQNVTGIIKVEQIIYEDGFGVPEIVYMGKRYKKRYGKLVPTKHKERGRLVYSLKKIEHPRPVHLL